MTTAKRKILHSHETSGYPHTVKFEFFAPDNEEDMAKVDNTDVIEDLEEYISCVVEETIVAIDENDEREGTIEYLFADDLKIHGRWWIEDRKPETDAQEEEYDAFQRAVEAVLIEFVERADTVLEHEDVAESMVIPIKDVRKFRDAVDTARDVLFG